MTARLARAAARSSVVGRWMILVVLRLGIVYGAEPEPPAQQLPQHRLILSQLTRGMEAAGVGNDLARLAGAVLAIGADQTAAVLT